jgi:hypothetical protein
MPPPRRAPMRSTMQCDAMLISNQQHILIATSKECWRRWVCSRGLTSWFTAGFSIPFSRAMAQNTVDPWYCAASIFDPALLHTKPSTTRGSSFPARAWAERHHPGVVGEPAAGCIPSVPPVGGWGRLGASSWSQIRRWDRRRCCWQISGPPGGPEIRWILSVGWCPPRRSWRVSLCPGRGGQAHAPKAGA